MEFSIVVPVAWYQAWNPATVTNVSCNHLTFIPVDFEEDHE